MRSAQRVVMDATSSVVMDANGANSPERSAKLKNDLEPIDDVSSTSTESDSVDYALPGSTMSVPESVRNAVRRGRRMTETAIEEAKPLVIDFVYCRSIGGMMIYIAMLGTLNNFSGRIRAETLGEFDGVVASILDAVFQFLFAISALRWENSEDVSTQLLNLTRSGGLSLIFASAVSSQIGLITGFVAQPYLSTLLYSLMNQAIVPFLAFFAWLINGTRFSQLELASVALVATGAIGGVLVSSEGLSGSPGMALFAALTTSFSAFSFAIKERVFRQVKGLHVLVAAAVVNTQCLLISVPVSLGLNAIQGLGTDTMVLGFRCLAGSGPAQCVHAPAAYAVYAIVNTVFNYALLMLTARGSAMLAFVALKLTVPLTALLSPLPWPLIGANPVDAKQWGVLAAMMVGTVMFRYATLKRCEEHPEDPGTGGLEKESDLLKKLLPEPAEVPGPLVGGLERGMSPCVVISSSNNFHVHERDRDRLFRRGRVSDPTARGRNKVERKAERTTSMPAIDFSTSSKEKLEHWRRELLRPREPLKAAFSRSYSKGDLVTLSQGVPETPETPDLEGLEPPILDRSVTEPP